LLFFRFRCCHIVFAFRHADDYAATPFFRHAFITPSDLPPLPLFHASSLSIAIISFQYFSLPYFMPPFRRADFHFDVFFFRMISRA